MNRLILLALALGFAACATTEEKKESNTAATEMGNKAAQPAPSQASHCDTGGKHVIELDMNKDQKADVWKVYHASMENGTKVEVLECKEVDLNFDGKKDIWVFYDDQ